MRSVYAKSTNKTTQNINVELKILLGSKGLYHYVPCDKATPPQLFSVGTTVNHFFLHCAMT